MFVFCFVRNPYDRCVSWYHHHRAAGLEPYWSLPFDGWVRVGLPHHWYRQNETDYHQERISPLLQSNFIDGAKVDFVGRVELFERDLRTVSATIAARCAEIGIDPPPCSMVAHENRSCRLEDWRAYYSPETLAIVTTRLARDFSAFGYPPCVS